MEWTIEVAVVVLLLCILLSLRWLVHLLRHSLRHLSVMLWLANLLLWWTISYRIRVLVDLRAALNSMLLLAGRNASKVSGGLICISIMSPLLHIYHPSSTLRQIHCIVLLLLWISDILLFSNWTVLLRKVLCVGFNHLRGSF